MKLAISSFAWSPADDDEVRTLLVARGVAGIEIAPMKYWPSAPKVPQASLEEARVKWLDAGIAIVALQGIFFGLPTLQLFGSRAQQGAFVDHFREMARVASGLGAEVIVFGAPKNRLKGSLTGEAAVELGTPVLRQIARDAHDHGVMVCVEPNPPRYGGDFVTTSAEAVELVRAVDHPGFGFHMDAGSCAISGESDDTIIDGAGLARHFHISEVDLVPVGSGTVDHGRMGALLRRARFAGWCSIEMLLHRSGTNEQQVLPGITGALDVAEAAYRAVN